ncbi:MAG: ribonuclease P protein component [Gammaproteobacteria bacterium]|nr:ribonuclease P protein component [Gammaproteobacteria bacterium]MDH5629054.1 ribonuclease P protein component [Gammaproteobacteria bacterium]
MDYKFQRELRLLGKKDFDRVFEKAFRVTSKGFTMLARLNAQPFPRLGLVIAKKNVKLANQRNLIKRLIREKFRLNQYLLDNYDLVILTRSEIRSMERENIAADLTKLFDRFFKYEKNPDISDKNLPKNT